MIKIVMLALGLSVLSVGIAPAQGAGGEPVPVTTDNFARAASDTRFGSVVNQGGFGKLVNQQHPMSINDQTVVRANRDLIHSTGVFDLDAGPVTVTLPDPGKRFLSMTVFDEDHHIPAVVYGAGRDTFSKEQVGTRYAMFDVRIMVDPEDPADIARVNQLQAGLAVQQQAAGSFEVPNWDQASLKIERDKLLATAGTLPDLKGAFGSKAEVDPVRHLAGTAVQWGGDPEKYGLYVGFIPEKNNSTAIYKLRAKDVPVDAFWSVTLYNADGFFTSNPLNAYSLSSMTAKKGGDGTVAIQFGGCDGVVANCLPTVPGWNYMVRLYRPRAEVLNGTWKFPQAQLVQ